MKKLSMDLELPLVCTNDAHYSKKGHWEAHDIHICLGTGKERSDPNRLRYATPEFYFKTQDEMYHLFKEFPQALSALAIGDVTPEGAVEMLKDAE